jgi:release factor glutamine methyltransferase
LPELAAVGSGVTVADALRGATSRLARAGCDSPRLDAELLLAEALGVGRERLVVDAGVELDGSAVARFDALVVRREAREPVAYILGRKDFRRITVSVDPRVLIPRPETELLVEVGLSLPLGASVVDVGTGSGAVALALKSERPDLSVIGTDVDGEALAVAKENGLRLGAGVEFVESDLLSSALLPSRFDAVLANLPYVASGSELPPEIARYEPAGALFAGDDGLDVIRRFTDSLPDSDLIALEVGFDQAAAVATLLVRGTGFQSIEVLRDLAGHERIVVARR